MSFRKWFSVLSLVIVALLVFFSWKDIVHAWNLLGEVNLWILSLIVPAQLLGYYASGAVLVSFLRAKGELQNVHWSEIPRFSLEFNFVNHVFPTAGLSGLSYAGWRFKKLGVSTARTALANMMRAATVFGVYMAFLLISLFALSLGGEVNRFMLFSASVICTLIVVGTLLFIYVVVSQSRSKSAGRQLARAINLVGRKIQYFTKRKQLVKPAKVEDFFLEMHHDYLQLHKAPRQLKKPLLWGVMFISMEIVMFFVVFASFGWIVSPAALLVAYGVAGAVSVLAATPGGAGVYEAVMIAVLAGAGVPGGTAIAAVVLARVILLLMTLLTGYIFYHLTLMKYGSDRSPGQPKA